VVRRGFLSLGIAFVASNVSGALFFASLFWLFGVCGDQNAKECGPQPASAYAPGFVLLALTLLVFLICIVSLARALALFALAAAKYYRTKSVR